MEGRRHVEKVGKIFPGLSTFSLGLSLPSPLPPFLSTCWAAWPPPAAAWLSSLDCRSADATTKIEGGLLRIFLCLYLCHIITLYGVKYNGTATHRYNDIFNYVVHPL